MLRSLIITMFVSWTIVCAKTINVKDDQQTIQAAIDSAMSGDTVLVSPGLYMENINFDGKNIVVSSLFLTTQDSTYILQTIIDGNESGSVILFNDGENSNAILTGFTITNGLALKGGGIYIENASPTLISNHISGNRASYSEFNRGEGAGIYISGGSPVIFKNKIIENLILQNEYEEGGNGSGIYLVNSLAVIRDNIISHNRIEGIFGDGAGIYSETNCLIEDNFISNNNAAERGGGIYLSTDETVYIRHNIISSNTVSMFDGFGEGIYCISGNEGEITDNTIINNSVDFRSSYISLLRNTFKNFDSGMGFERNMVSISGSPSYTVEDNQFVSSYIGHTSAAIRISGTRNLAKPGAIKNNLFEDIAGHAIRLTGTGDSEIICDILNNKIRKCGYEDPFSPAIDIGGTGQLKINVTISGNVISGSKGPALSISGISDCRINAWCINNTIVNNPIGILKGNNIDTFNIANSIIMGNQNDLENVNLSETSFSVIGDFGYAGHNSNFVIDPQFINTSSGDYNLKNNSPCIDAGDPLSDYNNEPAYNGKRINIGAYGNTDQAVISSPEIELPTAELVFEPFRVNWQDTLGFWLRNTGQTRLNIDSLFLSVSDTFSIEPLASNFIPAADSLKINIIFKPKLSGSFETDLTLMSNDEDEGSSTIKIRGSSYYEYFPIILSIKDIPNDNGKWVKFQFAGSDYDTDTLTTLKSTSAELYTIEINDGLGWTAAASTAAYGKTLYSVLVPTTKDSSAASDGLINFRVIAAMDEGNYASNEMTGYSVDNLAPAVPADVTAKQSGNVIELSWQANNEDDFQYYTIYRGTESSGLSEQATTIDTHYSDEDIVAGNDYSYAVTATDHSGNESSLSDAVNLTVAALEELSAIPDKYYLAQNYPNPFNPTTTISFALKEHLKVKLSIYDVRGHKVKDLINDMYPAGVYQINWDATNQSGDKVASAIYYYKLQTQKYSAVKKMIYIK